jgi:hypothetical protein
MHVRTYIDINTLLTSLSASRHKRHGAFVDFREGLLLHDIGHGISLRKEPFSLAMLQIVSVNALPSRPQLANLILEQCREHRPARVPK